MILLIDLDIFFESIFSPRFLAAKTPVKRSVKTRTPVAISIAAIGEKKNIRYVKSMPIYFEFW